MSRAATHSPFGGMWIDRLDWQAELLRRGAAGRITQAQAFLLQRFTVDGFVILRHAAPGDAIARLRGALASAFRHGNPALLYQPRDSDALHRITGPVDPNLCRVVDSHAALAEARALLAVPPLIELLTLIFDAPPLLFRSLYAAHGGAQPLHQDTAYIAVDPPMELAGCWIALEDVRPGAGEPIYVPGSHRLPDYDFGTAARHWGNPDAAAVAAWSRWLEAETARRDLPARRFQAREGDILLWHGDLAHGCAPVLDASLSRHGLLAHFCPSTSRPAYFDRPGRGGAMPAPNGLFYASEHYEPVAPPPPRGLKGRLAMAAANRRG